MLFIITAIVLICLNGISQASKCPKVTPKKDFDVTKYVGVWYEIYRGNVIFEIGLKCVNATYTSNADGSVGVWNQAINLFGFHSSIKGSARVKNAMEPGAFEVTFDRPNQKGDYNVIATDYANYSVVYSCRNLPIIGKWEFIWFLSRTKSLTPTLITTMKKTLSDMGVSTNNLKPVSQSC